MNLTVRFVKNKLKIFYECVPIAHVTHTTHTHTITTITTHTQAHIGAYLRVCRHDSI